jgi:hypothetical protein
MQTILGTPYTPPTPDQLQAVLRAAHRERAEATRDMWNALFRLRRAARTKLPVADAPMPQNLVASL